MVEKKKKIKVGDVIDGKTVVSAPSGKGEQTYQIGNTQVSKEEFKGAVAASGGDNAGGGKITDKVTETLKELDQRGQERIAKNKLLQQNIQSSINERILEAEGKRLGIIPEQSVVQTPTVTPRASQSRSATFQNKLSQPGSFIEEKVLPDALGKKVQAANIMAEDARSFLFSKETVITALDSLTGGSYLREPLAVKTADKAFTEIETELNKAITELEQGTGDAATVNQLLQQSQDTLEKLEEFQHNKSLNSLYLKYWIDEGLSLQTKIDSTRAAVQRLTQRAILAEQVGNLKKTQALYGA